jgi:uncharacterized protein (TIGR02246 family)
MRYTSIAGLLCGLSLPGLALAQAPGAVRAEVEAAVRAYVAAHNRGDAGGVAALYGTQPGVTSIGDGEIVRGWDRIREQGNALDTLQAHQGHLTVTLGSLDITPLGTGYALAIAPYTLTVAGPGGAASRRGAMTLVLQKVAGEWKIIHDHTSTVSTPAAGAVAAAPPARMPGQPAAAGAPAGGTMIPIVSGTALEIPAQQVLHYDFQIPAGVCTVTGRVQGISGGDRAFEVLIVDDANYSNWTAGLETKAYGTTGRVTMTDINTAIPGPGVYHLVISNAFSATQPKTVQVWAQAHCP